MICINPNKRRLENINVKTYKVLSGNLTFVKGYDTLLKDCSEKLPMYYKMGCIKQIRMEIKMY